jgi:glycosyltransferase involved in cell wall biosynthesis
LLGEVQAAFREHLLTLVPPARRSEIEFLPLVAPDALPGVIARHDVGLALEQATITNRDLTITNKILQYLNAGLTVVATQTAGQREVLAHHPDAGVLVDLARPDEVAAQLDLLLRDRDALQRRQRAARRLAEDVYCWERERPRLLALVEAAVSVTKS